MILIRNVLVPTDFSDTAAAAVDYGRTLAEQFSATLHLVHVVDDVALKTIAAEGFASYMPDLQRAIDDSARKQLDAVAGRSGAASATIRRVIMSNQAAEAIVTYAASAAIDMIVIGTHGRTGVSRLLYGSVAERVVRTAPCPVLTVHAAPPAAR
jgi:nucleotide-binding universal stress UspA family protein